MTADSERVKEGAALAKSGQFDQALSVFEDILRSDPDHIEALFMRGACHYKLGNNPEAAESWNRVLAVDPNHSKAKNMLAKVPTETEWDTGGFAAEPPAPPSKNKAEAPPSRKTRKETKDGSWKKKIVVAVIVLALAVFAADMYLNPNSYPFLRKDKSIGSAGSNEVQSAQTPSSGGAASGSAGTSLEAGLSGKWFFLFEGSPAEFNFHPNGRLAVTIKREGGVNFNLDGAFEIQGDTITFNVNTPQGEEVVKAYNAKIVGPDFTFNYDSPNGPLIEAERR